MPDATGNQDGIDDIAIRLVGGTIMLGMGMVKVHENILYVIGIVLGIFFIMASLGAIHQRKLRTAKEVAEKL
jgi:hypothetical protein